MYDEMIQKPFFDDAPAIVNANEPHMACLFLVDTSGSMYGDPIAELNKGLNRFKEEVCADPVTREVLDVAVVAFNNTVNVVQEFTPVSYMQPVNLSAGGGTGMGAALREGIRMIDERYRFYRRAGSEPYCPWIVMITDGVPTDSVEGLAQEIEQLDRADKMRLWSLAVSGADTRFLNELGHHKRVLVLRDMDFTSFFNWVSKSMRSISVSSPGEKAKGERLPENVDKAVDDWM
jgi:uncharacterized protein YegL